MATRPRATRRVAALAATLALAAAAQEPQDPPETQSEEPILGSASSIRFDPQESAETVFIEEGTPLRTAPHPRAQAIATVDIAIELAVLETRDGWRRVRFGDWAGWIAPEGMETPIDPGPDALTERALAPLLPAALDSPLARQRRERRLERARRLLGLDGPPRPFGPFTIYTDIIVQSTLDRLEAVVTALPAAYRQRFGREAQVSADFTLVVFNDEEDYREYEAAEELSALALHGHAGDTIAVLYVGRRRPAEFAPLLVHEVTHLLNRSALGSDVPAWLEEGMANDLAYSRIDADGRLLLGTLGGNRVATSAGVRREARLLHYSGPIASYRMLMGRLAKRALVPLTTLIDLSWSEFVHPRERALRYTQSAFLVRFLIETETAAGGTGFDDLLAAAARTEALDPARVAELLGTPIEELDQRFQQWLRSQPLLP